MLLIIFYGIQSQDKRKNFLSILPNELELLYADQKFPPKFPHFSTQISTFVQNFHADVCRAAVFFGYG